MLKVNSALGAGQKAANRVGAPSGCKELKTKPKLPYLHV
jgi:hypothetical protein